MKSITFLKIIAIAGVIGSAACITPEAHAATPPVLSNRSIETRLTAVRIAIQNHDSLKAMQLGSKIEEQQQIKDRYRDAVSQSWYNWSNY